MAISLTRALGIMKDNVAKGEITKEKYLNFCNLLEAVLAYHKAYGGKD